MNKLKILEITEEEKNALREYCDWRYTYINLLTSGSMEAIDNLDNISLKAFSKNSFSEAMKIIKNVYSAMCKYSYNRDSSNILLYRGTTERELDYIRTNNNVCDKILSTSSNEDVARQHAGDRVVIPNQKPSKKVVLNLNLVGNNVPYIDVNDVLGEDTSNAKEEEFVLSPFCKFENIRYESGWKEIKYYGADINETEIYKADNQSELENEIASKIKSVPSLAKEYLKYKSKSALDEFNSIRKNIVTLVKSMCADTREQIYEKAQNDQMKDINLEDIKLKQKDVINTIIQRVETCIKKIDKDSKYEILAKKLDLNWNTGISKDQIDEKFSEYIQRCSKMIEGIDEIQSNSGMSINKQVEILMKSKNKLDSMKKFIKIMESQVSFFSDENCDKHIRVLLNQRVDELIKKAQINDIDKKIEEIDNTRVGFFDRINGKAKELELKREQLSLNRQLVELNDYKDDNDYTVDEITAKIFVYGREHGGILSQELSDMISRINNAFPLDATKLQKIINEKTEQKGLIPIDNANLSRRKANARLQETNESIRKEIEYQKSSEAVKYRNSNKISTKVTDVPQMVYDTLRKVVETTEDRDYIQDTWKMVEEQ